MQNTNNSRDEIKIRAYLAVLTRGKTFIIIFLASAVLTSLALTYITSEKYQAATTIFYRPMEINLLKQKETAAFGSPVPTAPFKVISQTLYDTVQNEVVLKPVVKTLKLDQKEEINYPSLYKQWYHSAKDFVKKQVQNLWAILKYGRLIEEDKTFAAIEDLRKNISITATKDSYIYILKVKDKYPERAVKIVDMVGENLISWLKNEYLNPAEKRLHQLEEQLISKENDIKSLQNEKQKMLDVNSTISVPEQTSKGLANLYQMELENLKITAQIEQKQREINEYTQEMQKQEKSYVQSGDYKTLRSQKLFDEIKLNGLISESNYLNNSIKELKKRLQELPSMQNKLDTFNVKIDAATREYQNLKDFYTEAFAEVTNAQSETKVLHPAEVSIKPVQPIKIYHVGLTVLLGLLFSIGLVYVLDFFSIPILFSQPGNTGDQINTSKPGSKTDEKTQDNLSTDNASHTAVSNISVTNRVHKQSIIRYILIILCGIGIAVLVFYLLKKLGY